MKNLYRNDVFIPHNQINDFFSDMVLLILSCSTNVVLNRHDAIITWSKIIYGFIIQIFNIDMNQNSHI